MNKRLFLLFLFFFVFTFLYFCLFIYFFHFFRNNLSINIEREINSFCAVFYFQFVFGARNILFLFYFYEFLCRFKKSIASISYDTISIFLNHFAKRLGVPLESPLICYGKPRRSFILNFPVMALVTYSCNFYRKLKIPPIFLFRKNSTGICLYSNLDHFNCIALIEISL